MNPSSGLSGMILLRTSRTIPPLSLSPVVARHLFEAGMSTIVRRSARDLEEKTRTGQARTLTAIHIRIFPWTTAQNVEKTKATTLQRS